MVPLASQKALAGLAGVDLYTRYFDAGHSPFVIVPEEVGEWIDRLAMVWEYGGDGNDGDVAVT